MFKKKFEKGETTSLFLANFSWVSRAKVLFRVKLYIADDGAISLSNQHFCAAINWEEQIRMKSISSLILGSISQ